MPYAIVIIPNVEDGGVSQRSRDISWLLQEYALNTEYRKHAIASCKYAYLYDLSFDLGPFCNICTLAKEKGIAVQVSYFADKPSFFAPFVVGGGGIGAARLD